MSVLGSDTTSAQDASVANSGTAGNITIGMSEAALENLLETTRADLERAHGAERELLELRLTQANIRLSALRSTSRLFDLPPVPENFTGREIEIAQLLDRLSADTAPGVQVIAGVRGIGGVGKTVLAGVIGHALAERFPDARFSVDLRGTRPTPMTPEQAMGDVILRFNAAQSLPDDPEQLASLYRATLSQHRALILLDNARDAAQIAGLAPPAPSAALATSRALITLPNAPAPLHLKDLTRAEAVALLATMLPQASAAELDALAAACADHALSLTVAGRTLEARWDEYEVAEYIAEIEESRTALNMQGVPNHDVMGSLRLSLTLLEGEDEALAERWRDLAVFAGEFGAAEAAVIWQMESATKMLRDLSARGFVEVEGKGRYRLHDLMRDLARLDVPEGRFAAVERAHGEMFVERLTTAKELYKSGGDNVLPALAAYDAMAPDVTAARARAIAVLESGASDNRLTLNLANAGAYLDNLRLSPAELITLWRAASDSAIAAGFRQGEGVALGNLANALQQNGEAREAIEVLERRLVLAREIGDRQGEGNALGNLGIAWKDLGEPRKAIGYFEQCLMLHREIKDRRGEGNALGSLGNAHSALGERETAIGYYEQGVVIDREIGNRRGEGTDLYNMADEYRLLGNFDRAQELAEQALAILTELGDPNIATTRRLLAAIEARNSS